MNVEPTIEFESEVERTAIAPFAALTGSAKPWDMPWWNLACEINHQARQQNLDEVEIAEAIRAAAIMRQMPPIGSPNVKGER